jgi:hypothetical protein
MSTTLRSAGEAHLSAREIDLMGDELSIIKIKEEFDVESRRADLQTAFFKMLANAAPRVGPYLAEVVGVAIPDHKYDRLVTFARVLGDRVKYLEEDTVKLKARTEEFADLLEDGLVLASRALTDERRGYIASLLKNSITNEKLEHVEEKKLLALLGELNDAEILTLKYYSFPSAGKREFAETHRSLFGPLHRSLGAPQEYIDKGALRDSYRNKLLEVGLVEPVFKRPEKGQTPEFDERTGRMKATSFRATALGKLLLRYIDQGPDVDDAGADLH